MAQPAIESGRQPQPLPIGHVCRNRFQIHAPISGDGFCLYYIAIDQHTEKQVLLREVAPRDSKRAGTDILLPTDLERSVHYLRMFMEEASLVGTTGLPIARTLGTFYEGGTAYDPADLLGESLENVPEIPMDRMIPSLLELLLSFKRLHDKGRLHLGVSPRQLHWDRARGFILYSPRVADAWYRDMYTEEDPEIRREGFWIAPELSKQDTHRGPASDLFALSATLYQFFTGSAPDPEFPIPLRAVRPDIPYGLAEAIMDSLREPYDLRAKGAVEYAKIIETQEPSATQIGKLRKLDETRDRLLKFRYEPRSCPVSGEVLEHVKPIPANTCFVCWSGRIKLNLLSTRMCACCRAGILHRRSNLEPLRYSPFQPGAKLKRANSKLMFWKPPVYKCSETGNELKVTEDGIIGGEKTLHNWEEWRTVSGRSEQVWECDTCTAQFDELHDGRWRLYNCDQLLPEHEMYPEEWARVAAGDTPGSGNAKCLACGTRYIQDGDRITVLDGESIDPHGFARSYRYQALHSDAARWLAAGKQNFQSGWVCPNSDIEFDDTPDGLKLIRTSQTELGKHLGEVKSMEEWHRIAQKLPPAEKVKELEEEIVQAIRGDFEDGRLPFAKSNDTLLWKGHALEVEYGGKTLKHKRWLKVTKLAMSWSKGLGKVSLTLDQIASAKVDDEHILVLRLSGGETAKFVIEPVHITVNLASGPFSTTLTAAQLAGRLRHTLRQNRKSVRSSPDQTHKGQTSKDQASTKESSRDQAARSAVPTGPSGQSPE